MPATITDELLAHIQGDVTTLCVCCKIIRKDGAEFGFTNHTRDVIIDSFVYRCGSGMTPSALQVAAGMNVDNAELSWIFQDDQINEREMRGGLFESAVVEFFLVNYEAPNDGILRGPAGTIGQVTVKEDGTCTCEFRSLSQKLANEVGDLTSIGCRTIVLGEVPGCGFDLTGDTLDGFPSRTNAWVTDVASKRVFTSNLTTGAPTVTTKATLYAWETATFVKNLTQVEGQTYHVAPIDTFDGNRFLLEANGNISVDLKVGDTGTVQSERLSDGAPITWNFTIVSARLEANGGWSFQIASAFWGATPADDGSDYPAQYFRNGILKWLSGNNAGIQVEVMSHADNVFTLQELMPFAIHVNDSFIVTVGCDRSREMCRTRFGNVIRFQGEPDIVPIQNILKTERV